MSNNIFNIFPLRSNPLHVPSYFISYHFDKIVKLFYVKRAKGINLQSLCNISDNCICQTTFLNYFLCAPTPLHEDLFLSIWYCIARHCIGFIKWSLCHVKMPNIGLGWYQLANPQSVCFKSDNCFSQTIFEWHQNMSQCHYMIGLLLFWFRSHCLI